MVQRSYAPPNTRLPTGKSLSRRAPQGGLPHTVTLPTEGEGESQDGTEEVYEIDAE